MKPSPSSAGFQESRFIAGLLMLSSDRQLRPAVDGSPVAAATSSRSIGVSAFHPNRFSMTVGLRTASLVIAYRKVKSPPCHAGKFVPQ